MSSNITKNFKAKSALRNGHGGDVKGPGGPTEDKVGPVMLSDGEYVLPADTVDAVGVDNLDALRDATHDFDKTKDAEGLAGGGVVDWIKDAWSSLRGSMAGPAATPTPTPAAAAPPPGLSPGTQNLADQAARRPVMPNGAPSSTFRPVAAPGDLPEYRTGSGFRQTPAPTNPSFRPATPAAPTAANAAPVAETAAKSGSRIGGALRGIGGAATLAAPVLMKNADTMSQREAAGGGRTGNSALDAAGNAAGQSGAYIGSAASFGGLSPQDIGGITSSLRQTFGGNMSGPENMAAWNSVPQNERGWARRGIESLQRAVGLAPELPDFSNVQGGVKSTEDMIGGPPGTPSASPVRDVMGSPAMANESGGRTPPPTTYKGDDSVLRGAGGYQGLLENRSGLKNSDPRINGSTSEAYNAMSDDAVIGSFKGRNITKKEADARAAGLQTASFMPQKPAEDPIMGEIRSALRGIGGGSRGGGSSFSGRDSGTDAINKRYDDLLRGGEGRNVVKGSDWSQRHGLSVETARAKELSDYAQNQSTLRGQDNAASIAADQNRTQLANTLLNMQAQREKALADGQSASAKAQQDALKTAEQRQKDMTASAATVAASFAAGDKDAEANLNEVLRTLPPEMRAQIEGMTPDEREATYSNIAREHIGRTDGLVMGRDVGATVQNTAVGGLLGTILRGGGGVGKGIDAALGKIPRVGPLLSALRPAENLARLGPLLGAGAGAYTTREVEGLDRWDPVARDPETGATIPAKKDLREAATYGAFDVYANPFDDAVQTRSGRRTDRPTPTEEEAARRRRSSIRE